MIGFSQAVNLGPKQPADPNIHYSSVSCLQLMLGKKSISILKGEFSLKFNDAWGRLKQPFTH